jgi:hypothetical protein
MRDSSTSCHLRIAATLLGLTGALAGAGAAAAAEDGHAPAATYQWSAELVAFDRAAGVATVKARLVETVADKDLPKLKAGDHAMLTWSGLNYAAGIRALERGSASSFDRLTMPIEYVSSELDGRYVVFKVPVPAADAAAIAALTAGQWVTAQSPQKTTVWKEAVRSLRPYTDAR